MSSTKGINSEKRSAFDFYPTPAVSVLSLLKHWQPNGSDGSIKLLEPGAGNGAIVRAVNQWAEFRGFRDAVQWTLVELDQRQKGNLQEADPKAALFMMDFLDFRPHWKIDAAIGNPPFTHTQRFVDHCLKFTDTVVFLQRLGFLGTAVRYDWWHSFKFDTGVLSKRPFPDSADYAWYIISPHSTGRLFHIHPSDADMFLPTKEVVPQLTT